MAVDDAHDLLQADAGTAAHSELVLRRAVWRGVYDDVARDVLQWGDYLCDLRTCATLPRGLLLIAVSP